MIPLIYIAGPFRGPTPYDVKCNVHAAERVGLEVARRGGYPVIPHTMTQSFDKQLTDEFWLEGTMRLLRCCEAIVLVPGWERSLGARAERDYAEGKLPIFYWAYEEFRDQLTEWVSAWAQNQVRV